VAVAGRIRHPGSLFQARQSRRTTKPQFSVVASRRVWCTSSGSEEGHEGMRISFLVGDMTPIRSCPYCGTCRLRRTLSGLGNIPGGKMRGRGRGDSRSSQTCLPHPQRISTPQMRTTPRLQAVVESKLAAGPRVGSVVALGSCPGLQPRQSSFVPKHPSRGPIGQHAIA
jgi:hypothetical protein